MSNPNQPPVSQAAESDQLQATRQEAFARVADFAATPESEFAAGPDIKAATGLDRKGVPQLGYSSFAELKGDALTWKAGQDEAARVQAYHDGNDAKAAEFTEGIAAYQTARDEATRRVDGLTFKAKLENGGEFGLKHNLGKAAELRSRAIADAEAEGLPVGHLKASDGLHVVTNGASERRTSELAGLLRAHDKALLTAVPSSEQAAAIPKLETQPALAIEQAADAAPETVPEPVIDLSPKGLRARAQRIVGWAGKTLRGVRETYNSTLDTVFNPERMQAIGDRVERWATESQAKREQAGYVPVARRIGDTVLGNVKLAGYIGREKASDLSAATATRLTMLNTSRQEYFNDKENGKRRKAIGYAAGALALVGTAVLAYKVGSGMTPHGHELADSTGNGSSATAEAALPTVVSQIHEGAQRVHEASQSVRLSHGDTVWHEAQQHLVHTGNMNPSNAQVANETQRLMRLNDIHGWEAARHLAEDTEIKL